MHACDFCFGLFVSVVGRQHNRYPDMSQEDRLIKHLIKKYEHRGLYGRPVLNFKDIIKVRFGIQLIQIMDLDERNQVLTINVWVTYVSIKISTLINGCSCFSKVFDVIIFYSNIKMCPTN